MALMTDSELGLAQERKHINEIDRQIAALLNERFAAVDHIATLKQAAAVPVLNPQREAQVLDGVAVAIGSKRLAPHARKIFATIMAESRAYQTHKIQATTSEEN